MTHLSVQNLVTQLAGELLKNHWRLSTAESCTGGLVAAAITSLSGSSDWFERGYVTYSNAAKINDIQVPAALIEAHGAVSEEVAQAMAIGAKKSSGSNISLAITGIAGPAGGTSNKPVGTVCFAWSLPNELTLTELKRFDGDRSAIREQSVNHSLHHLIHLLNNNF